MPAKAFLDTNVLIYAFAANDPKNAVAEEVLERGGGVSVQVLNEFANVCKRKLGLDWPEIDERIDLVKALLDEPAPITSALHDSARALAREHQFSFYDALIVAAAIECGADQLVTEDLQHGRRIGSLVVVNPFLPR